MGEQRTKKEFSGNRVERKQGRLSGKTAVSGEKHFFRRGVT